VHKKLISFGQLRVTVMDIAAYLHDFGCNYVNYEARETRMIVIANPEVRQT
jgi:hypothetical protein